MRCKIEPSNCDCIKRINDSVTMYEFHSKNGSYIEVRHECDGDDWHGAMHLRENDEGPVYWCCNCGYTLENGEAMAVRLYEADF